MKRLCVRLILVSLVTLALQSTVRSMTLQLESGSALRNGSVWIVDSNSVVVKAKTSSAGVLAVTIQGAGAIFSSADSTWYGGVALAGGLNTITAIALNADANTVDSNSIDIVYAPAANHVTGTMDANSTWSGAYVVDSNLTVPAGEVLTIEAGTWVLMGAGARINVYGQLLAKGTEDSPIHITRYSNGVTWKEIMFVDANDSRFSHCVFEYAVCDGDHKDYYDATKPRTYHEAIAVLASHVDFEGCTFQNLISAAGKPEGDAMAIIADDLYHPGVTSATVKGCKFLSIGQGVHTRYAYVLVQDCYFKGKTGDNDDVDMYGESTPPCLVQRNLFDTPAEDDRVHPTLCSAIIRENIIKGGTDHGIVLRDRSSPIAMNNLILNCTNGGIAVENTCTALLINNTIVGCGRGVRLFDLGRWTAPYYLHPGGGTATVINCIIWNCSQPITLTDTSSTAVADKGSHVTVLYCDIKGGQSGISKSGTQSTFVWGQGNLNVDPLFVNTATADYHLQATSPVIDKGQLDSAPENDLDGYLRPCGAGIDMGAYEFGSCKADPNAV
jgi:parallel beta-helix repeat protein